MPAPWLPPLLSLQPLCPMACVHTVLDRQGKLNVYKLVWLLFLELVITVAGGSKISDLDSRLFQQ
jgi:hypothetical protein